MSEKMAVIVSEAYATETTTLLADTLVKELAGEFAEDILAGHIGLEFFDTHEGMMRTRKMFMDQGIKGVETIGGPKTAFRKAVINALAEKRRTALETAKAVDEALA